MKIVVFFVLSPTIQLLVVVADLGLLSFCLPSFLSHLFWFIFSQTDQLARKNILFHWYTLFCYIILSRLYTKCWEQLFHVLAVLLCNRLKGKWLGIVEVQEWKLIENIKTSFCLLSFHMYTLFLSQYISLTLIPSSYEQK